MKVIEPKSNSVRAGSILEEEAFKTEDGRYFIVLDMQDNYFDNRIRPSAKINYKAIWVFNVKTSTLGVFDEDKMVEPVEIEAIVKEKA